MEKSRKKEEDLRGRESQGEREQRKRGKCGRKRKK